MQKNITLSPGESKIVVFTFTPSAAKSYNVSVDGLSDSFSAIEPPQAIFEVKDLAISPTQVYVGEQVSIACEVTNIGGKSGSYEVNCEVT